MDFNPKIFGQAFHEFVDLEYQLFGKITPLFHICSIVIILLVFLYGNKIKKLFTVYFTLNWLFLTGYWGIFAINYWSKVGIVYLLAYIFAPILLIITTVNWIVELFQNKVDLDYRHIAKYRYIAFPFILWGLWYPTYQFGYGFTINLKDLLFSYYGLMPCPTTIVVLGLFTLNYPRGNKILFRLMATYAVFIGTASVLTGWLPDVPFIIIGLYAFMLIFIERRNNTSL